MQKYNIIIKLYYKKTFIKLNKDYREDFMKEIINKNKSIIAGFTVIVVFAMCLILIDNEKTVLTDFYGRFAETIP